MTGERGYLDYRAFGNRPFACTTTANPSSVRRTLEDLNGPIYPKVFPIGAGRFNFVA